MIHYLDEIKSLLGAFVALSLCVKDCHGGLVLFQSIRTAL